MCVLIKEADLQLDYLHWAARHLVLLLEHLTQALQLPVQLGHPLPKVRRWQGLLTALVSQVGG